MDGVVVIRDGTVAWVTSQGEGGITIPPKFWVKVVVIKRVASRVTVLVAHAIICCPMVRSA